MSSVKDGGIQEFEPPVGSAMPKETPAEYKLRMEGEAHAALEDRAGERMSEDEKRKAIEIKVALDLAMLKMARKGQKPMTKDEQIRWAEARLRPLAAGTDEVLTPAQRDARDRRLERIHQEKLVAAKRKAQENKVPEEEVARMTLVDVLRAENIAAGKGALVHLTDREIAEENRRMQAEKKASMLDKISGKEKQMAKLVLDHVLNKGVETVGLTDKEKRQKEKEKERYAEEADKLRRAEEARQEATNQAKLQQDAIINKLATKRRELQWEWGYDPNASAQERALSIAACNQRRDTRVIRMMQIVKHHSLMLFNVVRDARKHGTPELDDEGRVINQDQRTWIRDQRLFLDIKVPPECYLDFAFSWQIHRGSFIRSLAQLEARWKAYQRKEYVFPSKQDRQEHKSLMDLVAQHDQDTHFVFRLTVQCDPLHHTLKAVPKTLLNMCGRDEYMFPEVIAAHRGGTVKVCPPLCANPGCSGVCLQPIDRLPRCNLDAHCREKKYAFCCKECKIEHLIELHPESEEGRKVRRKKENAERIIEAERRMAERYERFDRGDECKESDMTTASNIQQFERETTDDSPLSHTHAVLQSSDGQ
jgi:hypothetical protein